ncbi:hypothetical protein LWC33_32275 [Pseudonocardia sp. RS11V-5]|uniref:hypothetical protein n=1 Tax=Pseudonocardia terrae TaxID=2905831 RepID=UPI001E53D81D|nr:hypothetical protein [Pseudonocardia terrae]MCE3556106.1 hypothetical protein [Pseudonocardia terrae]
MSRGTAYLNQHGMKSAVLKELQRFVGPRAVLSVFGDRWVLTSRTGMRSLFDDVEALATALVAGGLVDRRALPAVAPLEQMLGMAGGTGAPRPSAVELAAALLAGAGQRISGLSAVVGTGEPPSGAATRPIRPQPSAATEAVR